MNPEDRLRRAAGMSEASIGEVRRLVVVGPTSRVDLSVPVHVQVGALLTTLLRSIGADSTGQGPETGGWVLQRLGDLPLDEESTTEDLDLVDGDVLHLRPRSEQFPPVNFDDLVRGSATATRPTPQIRKRSSLFRREGGGRNRPDNDPGRSGRPGQ